MQSLKQKQFKINTLKKENIIGRGFRLSSKYKDGQFYTMNFSCYSYHRVPVLFCSLTVNGESGFVDIEVEDENGTAYAPWYNDEYSHPNRVVDICNNNIIKKLNYLGIVEFKTKSKKKIGNKKK